MGKKYLFSSRFTDNLFLYPSKYLEFLKFISRVYCSILYYNNLNYVVVKNRKLFVFYIYIAQFVIHIFYTNMRNGKCVSRIGYIINIY